MAEESDLEKTEPASSRRLEQEVEEGQGPRSRETVHSWCYSSRQALSGRLGRG